MPQIELIEKTKLVLNFMTSQPGYQTIIIHILPNISRSKSSQTMKLQLIEYNLRNIVLEKSYTKYIGRTCSRPLSVKLKLSISLIV